MVLAVPNELLTPIRVVQCHNMGAHPQPAEQLRQRSLTLLLLLSLRHIAAQTLITITRSIYYRRDGYSPVTSSVNPFIVNPLRLTMLSQRGIFMKKHKRDKSARAYKKGYQAGLFGKAKDSCPMNAEPERQEWLSGWSEGRRDNWDGLTGVSSVPKVSTMY